MTYPEVLVELSDHTTDIVDLLGQLLRGNVLSVKILRANADSGDPVGAVSLDGTKKSSLLSSKVGIVSSPDADKDLDASSLGSGNSLAKSCDANLSVTKKKAGIKSNSLLLQSLQA